MAKALGSTATIFVCPPLVSHRALRPEDIVARLDRACPERSAVAAPSLGAALGRAWEQGNMIGATGSVFLVGELLTHLAFRP